MNTPSRGLFPERVDDEDKFGEPVRHTPLADLLKQMRKDGKVNPSELAHCLAAAKVSQPKSATVLLPIELVDLIGKTLLTRKEWAEAQNDARHDQFETERRYWQELADQVWKRHPGYTAEAVAEIIVPKDVPDFIIYQDKRRSIRPTLVNDVRRKIRPRQK